MVRRWDIESGADALIASMPNYGTPNLDIMGMLDHRESLRLRCHRRHGGLESGSGRMQCKRRVESLTCRVTTRYHAVIDETIASSRAKSKVPGASSIRTAKLLQELSIKCPKGTARARRAEFLQIHFARLAELSLPDGRNAVCWSLPVRCHHQTFGDSEMPKCRSHVHAQTTV